MEAFVLMCWSTALSALLEESEIEICQQNGTSPLYSRVRIAFP
jgi:hypothetical protein